MIFIEGGTLLRPKQIRLSELITVDRVLASRGCEVLKEGVGLDTILPKASWKTAEADLVFRVFHEPALRKELLEWIEKNKAPTSEPVTELTALSARRDRQAFSTTFEWYVGELLIREFQALSSSYGVRVAHLARPGHGGDCGDYDVLSVMGDTSLFYVECKTGGFTREEVIRMADRCRALHCTTAVMMLGKQLYPASIKAKLDMDHPNLSQRESVSRVAIPSLPASYVLKWGYLFFVDAGEEGVDVASKLRTILRLVAASRVESWRNLALSDDLCRHIGYEVDAIE